MTTPPVAPQALAADGLAGPVAALNTHLAPTDQQAYDRLATLVAAVRVDGSREELLAEIFRGLADREYRAVEHAVQAADTARSPS